MKSFGRFVWDVNCFRTGRIGLLIFLFGVAAGHVIADDRALARSPIVMEEATTYARLVLLEDGDADRQVLEGVRIEVWTADEDGHRDDRLHRTQTDSDGKFKLPFMRAGSYILNIGKIDLAILVRTKRTAVETDTEIGDKAVLILVPRSVL